MTRVLNWIRSNVVIVICVAAMLAAAIALPMLSANIGSSVKGEMDKRIKKWGELSNIANTQITILGVNATGVVNPKLLEEFEKVAGLASEEANRVRDIALTHNQKNHALLLTDIFLNTPSDWRENLQFEFYRRLEVAYAELLAEIRAGTPPSADVVNEELKRRHEVFLAEAAVSKTDQLDEEQHKRLVTALSEARLAMYGEQAKAIGIYASPASISQPFWDTKEEISLTQWFLWQWDLWVKEDVLRALNTANTASGAATPVLDAPVKRILSLRILDDGASAGGDTGGAGVGRPGFANSGGGAGAGRNVPNAASDPSAGGAAAGAPAVAADPKIEVPLDYSRRFTGRKSNSLYDVKLVDLELIVDSRHVPAIVDALAKQNFITIVDLELTPADPFVAVQDGYLYGTGPTSVLYLQLETIWLRQWTSQFMPEDVKRMLGVPIPPPATAG